MRALAGLASFNGMKGELAYHISLSIFPTNYLSPYRLLSTPLPSCFVCSAPYTTTTNTIVTQLTNKFEKLAVRLMAPRYSFGHKN